MTKGINENQLLLVLVGLEHTLKEGSKTLKQIREECLPVDLDDVRDLLKNLKDALRFTKRCVKEHEETEDEDIGDCDADCCDKDHEDTDVEEAEDLEEDQEEESDDEDEVWCEECSCTHSGDCDSSDDDEEE